MKPTKIFLLAVLILATAIFAVLAHGFATVSCPYHPTAVCRPTGTYQYIGGKNYNLWECTCGDSVWVR
jgi:hypothetical protein